MEEIGKTLKDKKFKKGRDLKPWQDSALRLWKKLGLKGSPNSSWFKAFKVNQFLAETAAYFVYDANARNPELLFYWKFNQLRKKKS